jgi:hypothetical protein
MQQDGEMSRRQEGRKQGEPGTAGWGTSRETEIEAERRDRNTQRDSGRGRGGWGGEEETE